MTAISIDRVTKSFGPLCAVDAFTLDVDAGTRTAIVGPSGSGKTTVLRLVAGFERPDDGSIAINGTLVCGAGSTEVPAHRRGVGYVAQDGALFPHLTVGGNVGFALPRGSGRDREITALLELVALDPAIATRRPDQLSGGQQQRVALARAMALRPDIILLDEPFSALDAELRVETRDAVSSVLRQAGVTAILVTHDPDDARAFADQVAVMRAGRLVATGTPEEVYVTVATT